MSTKSSPAILAFRWIVFILALGYWFYQFTQTNLSAFGWQFRFLTIWGLTANTVVAFLMLRYSLGKSEKTYNPLVSATVVLGAMVVFLYWKLWFIDPALVSTGTPVWHQEYYLHALGPALMMVDAFFILGVFRRIWASLAVSLTVFLAYIAWSEIFVGPNNSTPVGKITSGLPYPFLNNMDGDARTSFYLVTIGTALVFFVTGVVIAKVLARLSPR